MKGVAIPYVVGIILAVGVILVVGYFLYSAGGKSSGSSIEEFCRGRAIAFCSQWATCAFQETGGQPDCTRDNKWFIELYPECGGHDLTISELVGGPNGCQTLLGG